LRGQWPKQSQLLQQNRNAWSFNALLSQGGKFAAEMDAICLDKSGRFRAEEVVMLVKLCSAHSDDSFEHKPVSLTDATGMRGRK